MNEVEDTSDTPRKGGGRGGGMACCPSCWLSGTTVLSSYFPVHCNKTDEGRKAGRNSSVIKLGCGLLHIHHPYAYTPYKPHPIITRIIYDRIRRFYRLVFCQLKHKKVWVDRREGVRRRIEGEDVRRRMGREGVGGRMGKIR